MYEFRSNEGGMACEETPEMRLKIEAGMRVCVCCVYTFVSLELDASVPFFFYFLLPVVFSLHLIVCLLNFVCHDCMIVCLSNFVCLCTTEVTGVHSWYYRCTLLVLRVYTADVTGAPCCYYQY